MSNQYALNISDLTRYDEIVLTCMVCPVIKNKEIIDGEPGRVDGGAVRLECPEEQAKAIVDWLRLQDKKARQYPIRAYMRHTKKNGTFTVWHRIGNEQILSMQY